MQFSAVKEVEHLHHDECIEDEGKVSGIHVVFLVNWEIVTSSINVIESATADCSTDNTIGILM